MTSEEQITICRAIAGITAWGGSGENIIVDRLDKVLPMERRWRDVYRENEDAGRKERVGVIDSESLLLSLLSRGYWLTNGDAVFNPPPMNGLHQYVTPELYQKHARHC